MPDSVSSTLEALIFHRLTEIPRQNEERDRSRPTAPAALLFGALVSAYTGRQALAVAWTRATAGGPIEVLVGGGSFLVASGPDPGEEVHLLYPPGSRGQPIGWADYLKPRFDGLAYWLRCGGTLDVLAALDPGSPVGTTRGRFEEYVAHLAATPFAWLVIAEPKPAATLIPTIKKLVNALHTSPNTTDEAQKLQHERDRANYRALTTSETAGIWDIHILVGGPTAEDAARVAALLCNASDIAALPYSLRPGRNAGSFDAILAQDERLDSALSPGLASASPFEGTTELLVAIARPPITELFGVRLVTPHTFDITAESPDVVPQAPAAESPGPTPKARQSDPWPITLGTLRDAALRPAGAFQVYPGTLNRHTFVCGATGGGKSLTVRKLLQELTRAKVPWLVIEPAKAEYARMAGRLLAVATESAAVPGRGQALPEELPDPAVFVIHPGAPDTIPASLNPLEPEPGFPLQTHADLVRALFLAAFEAQEPFPQVLAHALTRCYQEFGWNLVLSEPKKTDFTPRYPNLGDLQRVAMAVVDDIKYGPEIAANVRGFVDVRIGSLRLGTTGRFFEGGHPLQMDRLLERNVVMELEDIGNDQDKAFLIGTVLIRLYERLRVDDAVRRAGQPEARPTNPDPQHPPPPPESPLRHVSVIEEAHRLLRNVPEGGPVAHAVELFANLLAETRAYREGFVIAEQIPSKILPDVIKNTALKIMHRLPAQDDRYHVGATMNLSAEQSQYVVSLKPGRAAVFTDGMDNPLLAYMDGTEEVAESAQTARRRYGAAVPLCRARSKACGADCREEGRCTLRELEAAALLAEDPKLILWIEMLVVAHLVGEPAPTPDRKWLAELKQQTGVAAAEGSAAHEPPDDPAPKRQRLGKTLADRILDCALGQRADAAVNARYMNLAAFYPPEDLAQHIAVQASAQLFDTAPPCDGQEYQWQAGRYRWADVAQALRDARASHVSGRHRASDEWEMRHLSLPGQTCSGQLDALGLHPMSRLPRRPTLHGSAPLSAIERAAAQLSSETDSGAQLTEALGFLTLTHFDWLISELAPVDPQLAPEETA